MREGNFAAPIISPQMRVEPEWIDYNGHLNMAYYLVLFDRAVDDAFLQVGLGPDYLAASGCSYFTAEIHTVYRRELAVGETVRVTTQLIDHDEKRIHAYFELSQASEGWVSATCEKLFLHVDMKAKKVVPFRDDLLSNLARMKAAHAHLPRPEAVGRSIGLSTRGVGTSPKGPSGV